MELDGIINEAVRRIKPGTTFALINQARPASFYLFNRFLPERNEVSYDVSSAGMTIRSTMAGLVAMDSPFPKTGVIDSYDFNERIAKIGMELNFSEAAQRKLYEIITYIAARSGGGIGGSLDVAIDNFLNWYDKLIIQPQLDTAEWMRGQALLNPNGISWQYNGLDLTVNYGMPAAAFPAQRTGTDGYGGTTSKFWTDVRAVKAYLKYNVEGFYAHPDTIQMILSNDANSMDLVAQTDNSFEFARYRGTLERASTDPRDRIKLVAYGLEAEVLDPLNPGKTKALPFLPPGKIMAIGNTPNRQFTLTTGVGLGGNAEDPLDAVPLGYTHIGPTIEGGNRPGRWGRIYRPEDRPEQITGQSAANLLPVVENTRRHMVLSTVVA